LALIITESCINCAACEPECPNHAIYPPAEKWSFSEGTQMVGIIDFPDGRIDHADQLRSPLSDSIFFIVPGKCTECVGFHEKPQCAAICPEECCVKDPEYPETKEELLKKKEFLH
jgi:ferredoxin